ncbi:MAG TPA: type II toxin-antitoxin system VapC family toxin [Vicinamibacterales bacterium]
MVLDSSVALTWCFEDEQTPASLGLLERVVEGGAVAPSVWPLEVLNALVMAERRKRVDAAQRHRLTDLLRDLPIVLDDEAAAQAWSATVQLAERHHLTVYDATYLELAQRSGLPLASLDHELRAAAVAAGVALVEPAT